MRRKLKIHLSRNKKRQAICLLRHASFSVPPSLTRHYWGHGMQASFEMTFVAKGFSRPEEAAATDGGDGDGLEAGSGSAIPSGEPDVQVVTKVKGPEPGQLCREWSYASFLLVC